MYGLFPHSEEFMFWDPEHIEEYDEWHCFAEFLEKEDIISNKLSPELNIGCLRGAPALTQLASKEYQ